MKPKPPKKAPQPTRPLGRPVIRIIEKIDAPPEGIVKAVFRVADVKRDERVKKGTG